MWIGVGLNVLLLAYFKYVDFFIGNFNFVTDSKWDTLGIAIPLGISFFTFQQIAYVVDCSEGRADKCSFSDYALFVSFFPQLIAGPIVHHREMMPQFKAPDSMKVDIENVIRGGSLFVIGLAKKVVVADSLATYANNVFASADEATLISSWLGALAYTFQLYFDFSGYSDMAIGAARIFNIKIPFNFDAPLRSPNIIEFWRRWHITLSNFITSYIYTPMVRAWGKFSLSYSLISLVLTMLIAGLWHGAGWTFVIFGGINGVALAVNHYWRHRRYGMPRVLGIVLTFLTFMISLVWFRAESCGVALDLLAGMVGLHGVALPASLAGWLNGIGLGSVMEGNTFAYLTDWGFRGDILEFFFFFMVAVLLAFFGKSSHKLAYEMPLTSRNAVFLGLLTTLAVVHLKNAKVFLYFQF
ncbi:MBOAT family protein [Pseudodesulfovibrio sp. zrk46]|uniref:MBOAT family O-acyltransferase n=1 Tax=Pseudodesulfovibrio sp. zrk46 TaxID=2725288 RepID=UPI0014497522|nr:MBOAT family protein [Pseudodesulfovibrio sp. zrk46]QJB56590.1 MBOAT family protein [Pseudodesulfovibrio sp. zrk46]